PRAPRLLPPFPTRRSSDLGPDLGPEAAEVYHAGGSKTDSPQDVRDVVQLSRTGVASPPEDLPVPVDARQDVVRKSVEPRERIGRRQGFRTRDDSLDVEHVAVHHFLRFAAARIQPDVGPLHQVPRHLEVRVRAVDPREIEPQNAARVVPRPTDGVPALLLRNAVARRTQSGP